MIWGVADRVNLLKVPDLRSRRSLTVKQAFSARLARGYVRLSLLLGAYAPLALLFGLRLVAKGHPLKGYWCFGLAFAIALNMFVMLRVMRAEPRDYTAESVTSGAGELAGFVATYLLPLIVVGDVTNLDLLAYALYFVIVVSICLRGNFLHLNPLLAMIGYGLYTVTTSKGLQLLVLSRGEIDRLDAFDGVRLCPGIILLTNNRSAREREEQQISTY